MRYGTGENWRRGIERRETGRGGYGLLYCAVAQYHDPERCTNEMGQHNADSWLSVRSIKCCNQGILSVMIWIWMVTLFRFSSSFRGLTSTVSFATS